MIRTIKEEEELFRWNMRQAGNRNASFANTRAHVVVFLLILACVLMQNCCSGIGIDKTTAEQQKKTNEAIWGGDAEAHKKRIP